MHILLYVLAAVAAAFLVFLLTAVITDYRPADREVLQDRSVISTANPPAASHDRQASEGSPDALPDSVTILCWNIGYGGLGDDMDFFYDGGTQVRTSRERTLANIEGIISEIRRHDADIIMLQEVDECSRRTYRINEVEMLRKAFPDYHIYLAYNYKSFFVPIPVKAPMGKIASGVMLMSRIAPEEVLRWQYPSRFPWPVSMFNLKRCLLTATFRLADGSSLVIGNTHNTAYDTGGMRTAETEFLGELTENLLSWRIPFIIGGDWNQYPPDYSPSTEELSDPHFTTVAIDTTLLRGTGRIAWDSSAKTLRHLNTVYGPESVLTVTDYYYVSDGISVDSVKALDLRFHNSDHQPVLLKVSFRKS
ncbi:MAG TPA: hypothetical protein IAB96_02955 [Candidatus Coprenecus pullicola]|nr:hypothetical protein [Candidatus Coprenecus pullicola]